MVYLSPFSFSSPSSKRRNTPTFLSKIGKRKREKEWNTCTNTHGFSVLRSFFWTNVRVCMIFILNRAAVFMCMCVCKVEQKPPCRFFLLFHSVFYYSGSFNSQNKNILSWASYLYHVQFFILWTIYITYEKSGIYKDLPTKISQQSTYTSREWRNEEGKGSETCINGGI